MSIPFSITGVGSYLPDGTWTVNRVAASGHRILLPEITGLGRLRIRWPIAPTVVDGGALGKEMDVMKVGAIH